MPTWDVFISHASEDSFFAKELAKILSSRGVRVWLDATNLSVGDGLREHIDLALSSSRFGIAIISKSYLEKTWTKRKLGALLSMERLGHKVLLPILFGITPRELSTHSPILADRVSISGKKFDYEGIQSLMEVISEVDPGRFRFGSLDLPDALLETFSPSLEIVKLRCTLLNHPQLLRFVQSVPEYYNLQVNGPEPVLDVMPDLWTGDRYNYGGYSGIGLYSLLDPQSKTFRSGGTLLPEIQACVTSLSRVCKAIKNRKVPLAHSPRIFGELQNVVGNRLEARGFVFAGRRAQLAEGTKSWLRTWNSAAGRLVTVLTYDRLLDAALFEAEKEAAMKRHSSEA